MSRVALTVIIGHKCSSQNKRLLLKDFAYEDFCLENQTPLIGAEINTHSTNIYEKSHKKDPFSIE